MPESELRRIEITICAACLDGQGEECHTPGCALWMHRVDLPIHESAYEIVAEATPRSHDEMVAALRAAGVLVWHGCTTGDALLPYPHPMPPGGVDLWRITEDPALLAAVTEETRSDG